MKKIALFSIAWFTLISAGETRLSHIMPILHDVHNCVVNYLNQPYYPMVPPRVLLIHANAQQEMSQSNTYSIHPIPTFGAVYTLRTLGAGLGLTIISSSSARVVIKSALLAYFMTTAKPTLDGFIHTKLSQYHKEKYQLYVPAATTGLSLLLAYKFLY